MVQVTGTLHTILNDALDAGSVEVALCGYGSSVPRENGIALMARLTDGTIKADASGNFTFSVPANDQISPAGTYYTVTIKNDNGDIAQVNAYRFTSNQTNYNLNSIDPYDPNIPPPPIPMPIGNQLQVIPYSSVPWFYGDQSTAWQITLTGDVINIGLANIQPGNLYTFIIKQDSVGGHKFLWASPPNELYNSTAVDKRPNATTIQTFVADESTPCNLYPIGPGTCFV